MSPDSLGHSVHNASGGTSYQNGCFSYISCNSKTGADNYTVTVNINTVKIDGIQYPISIPRGYIYDSSIAHPQMLSSVSAGGTILVAGRTYYKVNDGDVITSLITIGNTTGIYNGPMNQKYPLFLSKNENAVEHYHNGNSTHLTAITSIIYNGETWYCGDVQSPQTTTTSSTYYTGGTLGNVSNGIPSHLCIGLIPVDLGNDIKINAIKKAAKKTLD